MLLIKDLYFIGNKIYKTQNSNHSVREDIFDNYFLIAMYNFIFYFIYKAKIKNDGDSLARYSASMIVAVALIIHLELLFTIIRILLYHVFGISITKSPIHNLSGGKSSFYIIISALLILLCFKFFNHSRVLLINEKFNKIENFFKFLNVVKFTMIFILPLVLSIYFSKHFYIPD
jgi:hypothetical protein